MNIARCGVWPTPKHLIAVLVDENGNAHPPLCVARSDAARTALIHWLAGQQYQGLVLPDDLICDPLVEGAIDARLAVWIAPRVLLDGIRIIAGLTRRPAKYTAALLARWPTAPALRAYLRHLQSPRRVPNQLRLL